MRNYDVIVVGGGIHGVSAAFHLADRGVRTLLIEKGTPASGPTGRSSAVCRAYYTNSFLAEVASASISMLRHFSEMTAGRESGYRETGALFLHPPEDVAEVGHHAQRLNGLGIETEVIGLDHLAERVPAFQLGGVGVGAWEVRAGYADPHLTTRGLFERARERGLDTRLNSRVVRLEERLGGGAIVTTDDGSHAECAGLLIAAGPWTAPLLRELAIDLPLVVERHIVAVFGWGTAAPVPFVWADLPGGYYAKPEGDDLFLLGSIHPSDPADPDRFDGAVSLDEALLLLEAAVARNASLQHAEPRGGWASLYDVSPDWQPVVGEVADGVFVDAGTSGHGFKLAPALGAHVADLVMRAGVDPGLRQFRPQRFAEGRSVDAGFSQARILG